MSGDTKNARAEANAVSKHASGPPPSGWSGRVVATVPMYQQLLSETSLVGHQEALQGLLAGASAS